MKIAVVTFDGFNEIDSFVAAHILNRVDRAGWKAEITAPTEFVTSMNGVRVAVQQPLEFIAEADAVLFGSGRKTAEVVEDASILSRIKVDLQRQLVASQCSGALILAKLGLLEGKSVCTDLKTKLVAEAAGLQVLNQPFYAQGNLASAGGCLSGQYLATWMIWRLAGKQAAMDALSYVAPVGQETEFISRAIAMVSEFIPEQQMAKGV